MTDKDTTPRYWRGEPGNRHEHANPLGPGGAKSPASRASWALTPEMAANLNKGRRDSDTSTSSQDANAEPRSPQSPQTVSERRRSSGGSGAGLFSNLQTQKRESADATMAGRRASWNEQRERGGFFSKLWDGYTRGK